MTLDIISLIIGAIGVVATTLYVIERFFPVKKISWKFAEKTVQNICNEMIRDEFHPTLLVGIGRGGAVMGALVSGYFGHKPLLVIDRKYVWLDSERKEDIICSFNLQSKYLENVLLIAGGVYSGNTMIKYHDILNTMGAQNIRRAALIYEIGAITDIEYKGIVTTRKKVRLPWMFSNNYMRDDRMDPTSIPSPNDEVYRHPG